MRWRKQLDRIQAALLSFDKQLARAKAALQRLDLWLRSSPNRIWNSPYRTLLGIVGGALVVYGLVALIRSVEDPERLRAGANTFGAIAIAIGLYYTARRIKASEDQVRVAEEGQMTERFTRAVDQLGSDNMAIRLGGIYALERIARDSPKDLWTVMEVLTAYVRVNSPSRKEAVEGSKEEELPLQLPTDIQTILTVIGRRDASRESNEHQLDLSGCNLDHADLKRANLARTSLFRSSLANANLTHANLAEASLARTNLTRADFSEANLAGASLIRADLAGADLAYANLAGADLSGAVLSNANLFHSTLSPAPHVDAFLATAKLTDADLTETDLVDVIGLTQPRLDSAHVDGTTQLPPGLTVPSRISDDDPSI